MAHSILNKVMLGDEVLMDISDSTVTPETLVEGVIAYNAAGERIVGTLVVDPTNSGNS